ncbi:hypothetical protein [Mesorhizobium sp. 43Arga]
MGQFSMEISSNAGSLLSGNQQGDERTQLKAMVPGLSGIRRLLALLAAMMTVASRSMSRLVATLGQLILGWAVTAIMAGATLAMSIFM